MGGRFVTKLFNRVFHGEPSNDIRQFSVASLRCNINRPSFVLYVFRSQSQVCPSAHSPGDSRSPNLPLHDPPDEERPHDSDTHLYVCLPGCCYGAGKHRATVTVMPVRSFMFYLKTKSSRPRYLELFKAALIHILELSPDPPVHLSSQEHCSIVELSVVVVWSSVP